MFGPRNISQMHGYPTIVGIATSTAASGTSHVATLPAGIRAGDLLLVFFSLRDNGRAPANASYKSEYDINQTGAGELGLRSREATAADTGVTTATFTLGSASTGAYIAVLLRNWRYPNAYASKTNTSPAASTSGPGLTIAETKFSNTFGASPNLIISHMTSNQTSGAPTWSPADGYGPMTKVDNVGLASCGIAMMRVSGMTIPSTTWNQSGTAVAGNGVGAVMIRGK